MKKNIIATSLVLASIMFTLANISLASAIPFYIDSISPSSRTYPAETFNLTINGIGFDSGAVEQIYMPDGTTLMAPGVIISQSDTQIVVTEAMGNAIAGDYTVYVMNSSGMLSNGVTFTIIAPPPVPTGVDQCKKDGWRSYGDTFKNQGDCVSFVATDGRNLPDGPPISQN